MNKILTIMKREYKETVFKKSFIILTIITPFLMIAITIVPTLLANMDMEELTVLGIYDESGIVSAKLQEALDDTLSNGGPRFILNILQSTDGKENLVAKQKQLISDESIDGFLYIPKNVYGSDELIYYSKNIGNFDLNRRLRKTVSDIVVSKRLQNSGIEQQQIDELTKSVGIKTIKITKEGEESERGFMSEFFSTFIFIMILYMSLLLYGTSIMRSIIQEKASRIIEVMLSSASPFQLMAGKIIGQGSVGLTQYVLWAIFVSLFFLFGARALPLPQDSIHFAPDVLIYFVLFYILGYFLYATMYAAIGAITNTDQEAQQASIPITLLLIVPILLLSLLVKNPNSELIQILSYIPFFSPIIMFARINLATPSFVEIWGSILILIGTIIFMIWFVAKIYRVGILMYGKRPTLPEIVRWLK